MSAATSAEIRLTVELRATARRLVTQPLLNAEDDPDAFRLIRRHEQQLDRWFTQRFGYRLQLTSDTARLYKTTTVANRRPLRTKIAQQRPLSIREYTMLSLLLAAISSGPTVTSLRDLLQDVRSAATEADVIITDEPADRRALVTAMRWLIANGIATEMHDRVDRYVGDAGSDAVLRIRPDRAALLPLPSLARADTPQELQDRPERTTATRQWMRAALLEEPVLYRTDLSDDEWGELRRRLGHESAIFEEMLGAYLEARAEGIAIIDPGDDLTDSRFPKGGTTGHAALLLLDRLTRADSTVMAKADFVAEVSALAAERRQYWSQLADNPESLADEILDLLEDHRLAEFTNGTFRLLPAAWRYQADVNIADPEPEDDFEQEHLF